MRYGKLTILSIFKKKRNTRGYRPMANCICDCGKEAIVQIDNLRSGHTTSCGCERILANTTHGLSAHPLYAVWEGVVDRCCNPKSKVYKYYGGRGIKLFNSWRQNPEKFIYWCLNNGYKNGMTIERKNVNMGYWPSNCTFIPFELQAKNTRKALRINLFGKVDTQRGWANHYGIHPATLRYRMNVKGLSLIEAVSL